MRASVRFASSMLAVVLLAACADTESGGIRDALPRVAAFALHRTPDRNPRLRMLTAVARAILGAAGSEVERQPDKADRAYFDEAERQAATAPMGSRAVWLNPENGHGGDIAPLRGGVDAESGAYCREFLTTINVGMEIDTARETACLQPDGSWRIVE